MQKTAIVIFAVLCATTSAGLVAPMVALAQQTPPASSRPNILFMLSDNVGFGVPSSYNGGVLDIPTPRIDELAAEGLRLTNFNVENQCTPSRAALMTGRLPIRSGIGKAIAAGAPGGLPPWEVTLAEMLGDAGYRTAMFGKWHLGAGQGRLPTDQGFDEWFGFETTDIIYWAGKPGMPLKDVDYIREAKKGEKPRNLRVYDEVVRRQIDRMVTDHAASQKMAGVSGRSFSTCRLRSLTIRRSPIPISKASPRLASLAIACLSTTITSDAFSTR